MLTGSVSAHRRRQARSRRPRANKQLKCELLDAMCTRREQTLASRGQPSPTTSDEGMRTTISSANTGGSKEDLQLRW